jgi:hypothetical protein
MDYSIESTDISKIGMNFYTKKIDLTHPKDGIDLDSLIFMKINELNKSEIKLAAYNDIWVQNQYLHMSRLGKPDIILISKENQEKYNINTKLEIYNWNYDDIVVYRISDGNAPGLFYVENETNVEISWAGNFSENHFMKVIIE